MKTVVTHYVVYQIFTQSTERAAPSKRRFFLKLRYADSPRPSAKLRRPHLGLRAS